MSEALVWFCELKGEEKTRQHELLKMNVDMHGLTRFQALQLIYDQARAGFAEPIKEEGTP